MTRIPYNASADDNAADKVARMIAAIPMLAVILAACIIGGALGWAIGS